MDRFTKHMVADKLGVTGIPSGENWSTQRLREMFSSLPVEERQAAAKRFASDERDTMTPAAMVHLLKAVYVGNILSSERREILLNMMQRCQTGEGALRGMLTPDTVVAHKTGTLPEVVANDVGVITLPHDAGHVLISVCIKSEAAVIEASSICQKTISHIARATFDYFLFY